PKFTDSRGHPTRRRGRRDSRGHPRGLERVEQLADAAHRLTRENLTEKPVLFGLECRRRRCIDRQLGKPRRPAVLVPLDPDSNPIAPLAWRERHTTALVDAAMRFEFRRFAVEDDSIEVEHDGRKRGHVTDDNLRRPYSAR